jgi:histidinol-phosphate/aromatic aminotransferase/cobyric acid decarboxylase-like protein
MNLDSDKTAEISVLEELRKPWSASSLTTKQIQQRQDISDTKKLWDKVLEEFRTKKEERVPKKSKELAATKGKEVDKSDQPFRFLDLPAEIRNAIYDMSLEDDNEA